MKLTYSLIAVIAATPALAHPTHVAQTGGHDHIVALVAITAAIIVALASGMKARTSSKKAV